MFELIEKIRGKSPRQKKIIALSFSLSFTLIIFLFWIVSVYPKFEEDELIAKKQRKVEANPTEGFTSVIKEGVGELRAQLINIKSLTPTFSNSLEYYSATNTNKEE